MPLRRAPTAVGVALVVAGPPAVGKSTLMRSMRAGGAERVLPQELRHVSTWEYSGLTGLRELGRRHGGRVEHLVLHVDISQLTMPRGQRLPRLELLLAATEAIHVLTLWAPPGILLDRLDRRQDTRADRAVRATERVRVADRERGKRALLADPSALDRLYETWVDFLAALPVASSRVVDSTSHELSVLLARPVMVNPALVSCRPGDGEKPRAQDAHGASR